MVIQYKAKNQQSRQLQELTKTFGCDAALGAGINDPVVVLERVDCLQHSGHTPHCRVDLRVCQELRGQVRVESSLHCGRCVDPQGRVKQHMIQQLPRQERETKQLNIRQSATGVVDSQHPTGLCQCKQHNVYQQYTSQILKSHHAKYN